MRPQQPRIGEGLVFQIEDVDLRNKRGRVERIRDRWPEDSNPASQISQIDDAAKGTLSPAAADRIRQRKGFDQSAMRIELPHCLDAFAAQAKIGCVNRILT